MRILFLDIGKRSLYRLDEVTSEQHCVQIYLELRSASFLYLSLQQASIFKISTLNGIQLFG